MTDYPGQLRLDARVALVSGTVSGLFAVIASAAKQSRTALSVLAMTCPPLDCFVAALRA